MNDRLEAGRTIEALRRKNLEGKRTFINELRKQGTPQSVSLLLEILCDESWYLRELAIGALVESGSISLPPLRGVFDSGLWYTRAAAARALGLMGDQASAAGILALLDESNRTVREAGVDAAKCLADNGGLGALCRAMQAIPPGTASARLAAIRSLNPDLADRLETGAAEIGKTSPPAPDSPRTSQDNDGGGTASPA